jgi:hypothetical protein
MAPLSPIEWPYHRAGSALSFPRDEGWHSLLPGGVANPSMRYMEWTYLNAHLTERGGAGRTVTVFCAYFTQNFRLVAVRVFDARGRFLENHHACSWGILRPSTEHLDLSFRHAGGTDTWRATERDGAIVPFASELDVFDDGAWVSLAMRSTKRPYEAGGTGFLPFGRRGAFSYYCLTRLAVEGRVTLPREDGAETIDVEGIGWFDHQWGRFYVTPFRNGLFEEYEWLCIQLDSGEELLLTTVWEPSGETPSLAAYGGVALVRADDTWAHLVGPHRWKRQRFWHCLAQNAIYSSGWELRIPEWNTKLHVTPRHHDQLMPVLGKPPERIVGRVASRIAEGLGRYIGGFWEGACDVEGTLEGRPVRGVGFAELVKRYVAPKIRLTLDTTHAGILVAHWTVTNPDQQVLLVHRYLVEDGRGNVIVQRGGLDTPVAVLDDPQLPKSVPLVLRVTSHSLDGTIEGTATEPFVLS